MILASAPTEMDISGSASKCHQRDAPTVTTPKTASKGGGIMGEVKGFVGRNSAETGWTLPGDGIQVGLRRGGKYGDGMPHKGHPNGPMEYILGGWVSSVRSRD